MNKQVWIEKALGLGIQEFEIYQSTTVEKEMTWWNCRWNNGQYGI